MFYTELKNFEVDIDFLKDLYQVDKHKMKKWSFKGVDEDYYEIIYKNDNGFLDGVLPLSPKSYQFVIIPPHTRIGIHRDVYSTQSKIGVKLYGQASINFYSERSDHCLIKQCDYTYPTLIDVTQYHDVVNNSDQWRVTFFASFTEPYDLCKADLHSFL